MPLAFAPSPRRWRSTRVRGLGAVVASFWLAGVAGCTAPVAPGIESGSRLRARWEVIGPDARRFVGWFDTVLGVPCTFGEDFGPNRSHRCVPTALATGEWFADAACSQSLAQAPLCGEPATFAVRETDNACAARSRYFRRGSFVATADVYHRTLRGECMPANASPAFRPDLYALGEEITETTFAAATETPASTGSRIRQLWLAGDDGSRTPWGGWDADRRVAVLPQLATDGQIRWLPTYVAYSELTYGDPACTEAIASKIAHDARCPLDAAIEFVRTGEMCSRYRFAVHAIGPTHDGLAEYAADGSGACVAQAPRPPSSSLLFVTGPVIPPESFALAHDVERGAGEGRIRLAAGPGGEPVFAGSDIYGTGIDPLLDTRHGEACRPERVESQLRCVPMDGGSASFVFQDAACSAPIALFDIASACRLPISRIVRRWVDSPDGPCSDSRSQWWSVGDVAASDASTPWFALSGTGCVPTAAPGPNVEAHRLDRQLGAADFLEVRETTD